MSDEINRKLDKIIEDISEIKIQGAVQNEQLKEHMYRTELLENRVTPIEVKVVQASTFIKILLGMITFLAGLPHAERLVKYTISFFH